MRHSARDTLRVSDQGVVRDDFLQDVLEGLRQPQKEIYSKYLYDLTGSELFDRITALEEYYPTRTELSIMESHQEDIDNVLGRRALIVEYGSGSSLKTRLLLDRLEEPAGYVPIDISRGHLRESAARIANEYPHIEVLPVVADYTGDFSLPNPKISPQKVVVYFPGSTIGNFDLSEVRTFLAHIAEVCGPGGGLLIGVDLVKDVDVLTRAYNDADGVTAAFNLNLLARMNRELGADFDLEAFCHKAIWNPDYNRIEMHLESLKPQVVTIEGRQFFFQAGETIHTENSHKFSVEGFGRLASDWFEQRKVWTDPRRYFSLQYLRRKS